MYEDKEFSYFSNPRQDIVKLLPEKIHRVLEVGCGSGETLNIIKSKFPDSQTVGIELSEKAAELASKRVDVLKNLDIEQNESRLTLDNLISYYF